MDITIQSLTSLEQVAIWKQAFKEQGIHREDEYYERCLEENKSGVRVTLFALIGGRVAGCTHLKYHSDYPSFAEQGIPEINDLNVFPAYRRRGIANRLIEACEQTAGKTHRTIGIGVGLYRSYTAAQRIYCRRGFIPDGNGLMYNNEPVPPGTMVRVDDDLNLYFTKEI
ncbi:GNAT family N-acetyltransferase [Paenibacillus sp. 1P07SE]|uniref:GNAT family N-acetyltransferase n=1 Tax=Paenibacillus sp. 1P07SE TaxID=3132209 RepID=UPI0039A41882